MAAIRVKIAAFNQIKAMQLGSRLSQLLQLPLSSIPFQVFKAHISAKNQTKVAPEVCKLK